MRKHRRFWILWFALALGLSLGLCASGLAEGGVQTPTDLPVVGAQLSATSATYNGSVQKPTVTVPGFTSANYTVDYGAGDYISARDYFITVTGNGTTLRDSVTLQYTINQLSINGGTVSLSETNFTYQKGVPQQPTVTGVSAGGVNLQASDYSATIPADSTNVGSYQVTVTGQGNCKDTATGTYTIQAQSLQEGNVTVSPADLTYDGADHAIAVTVHDQNGNLLSEGTDYTVSGPASVKDVVEGGYTITVSSMGNYTGDISKTVKVSPASISLATITVTESATYNGQRQAPQVTVTAFGQTLVEGMDYAVGYSDETLTAVGEYSVTITGKGNYTGEDTKPYRIKPADLTAGATASLSPEKTIYNGQRQEPKATVTALGQTLAEGTDYTVEYDDSTLTAAKPYTVKIEGTGNYTGELTLTYAIEPKPLADGDVTLDWAEAVYNRGVQKAKPTVTVMLADGAPTMLQEGTDYTVTYENDASTDAKTYQVTVRGCGNYQGDIIKTYTIIPYDLAIHGVTIADITDYEFVTYNGLAKEPRPDVFDKEAQQLTADTDITYSYADNVLVGTATVTVSGTGSNYTGSAEKTFAINWLATDAEAILIGTAGDHGWYKEKTVQVTAPAGFTIGTGIDAAEAGWKPYLEGHEGINQVTYHLRDEAGYITDARSLSFKQDTVAPTSRPLGASFRSGSTLVAVASDPTVNGDPTTASGAVLQFIINNGAPMEFTAENSKPAANVAANEICGSCAIVGPGTYRIVLLDGAGNVVGEIFNHYFSDSDGDGLSDVYEENNPRLGPGAVHEPDFDHDGLSDGQELLQYRTDPSQADSDHDGLLDGEEVLQYHTNPTSADSDLDGVDDYTSVAVVAHFDYLTYPTALRVMLRAGTNQADALLDQSAMADALNKLAEYNYLEAQQPRLYEAFRSTALRRQTADGAYQLFNFVKGLDNSLVKANVAQRTAYGINTEGGLFVTFTVDEKSNRFTPVSAYVLEELFGIVGDAYSVTCDDQGTLFLVACWSGESQTAQADLALLVPSQGAAYRLPGTAGSSRFGVSPDGSKLAYVLGGKANVIDLVTCNAAGEYVVDASTLGFTQDGGIITALNGHQADVWHVDANTYAMTMSKVDFNGIVDLVQPTTDSRSLMVLLGGDDQLLDGKDQVRVDVQGKATLLNGMRGLAYRPAGAARSTSHSGFFAQ